MDGKIVPVTGGIRGSGKDMALSLARKGINEIRTNKSIQINGQWMEISGGINM